MISYTQAALLGLLQGVAELFPVSSLGHTVLIPALLHWEINRSDESFVSFVVFTHMATALVLVGFFRRDWVQIVLGLLRSLREREIRSDDTYAKLAWLLVIGTIPAGVLGLLFEETLKSAFAATWLVAGALVFNGGVLMVIELMDREPAPEGAADDRQLAALSYSKAVLIGLAQSLALVPGFSRTGLTIAGGLLSGLNHENAGRFSFLLATPIILAAAVLKVPGLFGTGGQGVGEALLGAACAAVAAFFSVRFLVRYFETKSMVPFAIYCVGAGLVTLALAH